MLTDMTEDEDDDIRAFLDKYGIPFDGTFQKIVNEGGNLRYGSQEPRRRAIPFFTFSGKSNYWNEKVQEDIYIKSKIGRYRIRGYGGARALPHLNDLAFKKDLSGAGRDPETISKVNMHTLIGGRHGAKPLDLSMPVMISPMSYGALEQSTKLAMAKAAAMVGISENTGEGGMMDEQREAADQLIFQMLSDVWAGTSTTCNGRTVSKSISARGPNRIRRPAHGKKVTEEIARIRGIPAGIDLRSPSRHPDILGADDLVIKVEEMREATGYRIPIAVKLGAGRLRDDIKIAVKDGFDFIELDGMQVPRVRPATKCSTIAASRRSRPSRTPRRRSPRSDAARTSTSC